jgi:hypothetical protein
MAAIGLLAIAITFILMNKESFSVQTADAETMSSGNYKMESDSINFGGLRGTSGSYIIEDTLGESATGYSSSTNYTVHAGYQQMNTVVYVSVTPASNVIMAPGIGGLTGGTSDGSTSFIVTTNNPTGYTATIAASSSPALNSESDSFADYAPGANPDFAMTNLASASSFAFTPEGADIDERFKDNGSSCNTGSNDTSDACWDGLSTSPKTILNRATYNNPAGTNTTLKFRAMVGASRAQAEGSYTATTTVTVLPI